MPFDAALLELLAAQLRSCGAQRRLFAALFTLCSAFLLPCRTNVICHRIMAVIRRIAAVFGINFPLTTASRPVFLGLLHNSLPNQSQNRSPFANSQRFLHALFPPSDECLLK